MAIKTELEELAADSIPENARPLGEPVVLDFMFMMGSDREEIKRECKKIIQGRHPREANAYVLGEGSITRGISGFDPFDTAHYAVQYYQFI